MSNDTSSTLVFSEVLAEGFDAAGAVGTWPPGGGAAGAACAGNSGEISRRIKNEKRPVPLKLSWEWGVSARIECLS